MGAKANVIQLQAFVEIWPQNWNTIHIGMFDRLPLGLVCDGRGETHHFHHLLCTLKKFDCVNWGL